MLNTNWCKLTESSSNNAQQTNKRLYSKTKQASPVFDHAGNDYAALIERQQRTDENKDTWKGFMFLPIVCIVAVQRVGSP